VSALLIVLAATVAAAVAAAVVAIAVALGGGMAVAATATGAKIEATQFNARAYICDEFLCESFYPTTEAFARCRGGKRALGGGVVQSGSAETVRVYGGSGPLDATGVTLETNDGDVAKQWYAAVSHSDHINQQRLFKVFAICE
jgi:hypothetical protein